MAMGERIFIMQKAHNEKSRAEYDRIFGKKNEGESTENHDHSKPVKQNS